MRPNPDPGNLRPCSLPPTANLRILWPGVPPGPGRSGRSARRRISPDVPETLRRERVRARRLRRLVARHRRVVHLGGWEHLVDWQDRPGLWGSLADLKPRRGLLDEADRLPDY
jgi:hypothetical protein